MIPRDYITEWRASAPWIEDVQVEQDLIICKALVDIFSNPLLQNALAFRGGTALYKLHLQPPARYSEDIDLVQVKAEPAGPVMNALHEALDSWLGRPRYKQGDGCVTFTYRFESEGMPPVPLRLKVEINTREHFSVHGYTASTFDVSSRWFEGACEIKTYQLNELLATKLRALYQRKKGRDLFDLAIALDHPDCDSATVVETFGMYMDHEGHKVSRSRFQENVAAKLQDRNFVSDIGGLLASGYEWNLDRMADAVISQLLNRLPE